MSNLMDKVDMLKSLGDNVTLSDIVRVLEAVVEELNSIKLTINNIKEQIDAVDTDLSNLENAVYGEIEIECPNCNVSFTVSIEDIPESGNLNVECPNCHTIFNISLEHWETEGTDD
ncbi:MAG TPA: zinc-ribbon domain-containing protein [bacterium]|nr:zinc-ribbon domain-containing protein [bacterium]